MVVDTRQGTPADFEPRGHALEISSASRRLTSRQIADEQIPATAVHDATGARH